MKPLAKEFRKNTYDYFQVWRDDTYAIYRQMDASKIVAYEVFKINRNEEREMMGNLIAASESVPPTTQWGTNAWTVATMADCWEKIEQMRSAPEKSATIAIAAIP